MRNQIVRAELTQKNASRTGVRRAWQFVNIEVYPAMRDSLNIESATIGLREKALGHERVIVRPNVRKNEIQLVETIRFLIQPTADFSVQSPESPPVIRQGPVFGWVEKVRLKRWHAHKKHSEWRCLRRFKFELFSQNGYKVRSE